MQTLSDLVFHLREVAAGRPALLSVHREGRSEELSAADFLRNIHSLAVALEEEGVEKGDRVAIFSENRPEWSTVDFACQLLGLPTVPVYPELPPAQVAYILRNSGSRWVFYSDRRRREILDDISTRLTVPVRQIAFDADAVGEDGLSLTRWMGAVAEKRGAIPIERFRGRVTPEDLASIVYTSGTTGDPKGVRLTHGNLVSNCLACDETFELQATDRAISFMSLSHIFQRTVDYLCFYRAVRLHYLPSSEQVAASLEEIAPTLLVAPPQLYVWACHRAEAAIDRLPTLRRKFARWGLEVGKRYSEARRTGIVGPWLAVERRLAERWVHRPIRQRFGGSLRLAITGGAALPATVESFYTAIHLPLYQGYGLTETSPVLSCNTPGKWRPRSVGQALPNVKLQLAEDGEILARGPGIMEGYWQNPEATSSALIDGWLHTGDLGEIDAEGFVFITGRKKELIVTSRGDNVAPQPIEQLLAGQSGIAQALVLGEDQPYIAALIVPDFELLRAQFGQGLSAEALIDQEAVREHLAASVEQANGQLAHHEQIARFELLAQTFSVKNGELTPSLKPRRRVIAERYAERIDQLFHES